MESNILKKELIRAVLERMQSVDMMSMTGMKKEEVHYDDVKERLNIPYINRDEVPLAMDVFEPVVEKGKELPVVVTIHGGGLYMGDRKLSRPFGRLLAHMGYLVFSVEYRLAPRANVCMQLDDVCAGLNIVSEMTVQYDVDYTRIFLAAESAGGYLAAYVAAMTKSVKLQEAIGHKPTRLRFKAIGLMSAMLYTNNDDMQGKMLKEQIYGDKVVDENFLQYMNPENPEIANNLPPAYLVTSRGDFLNNYSIKMTNVLKRLGKPCHLLYYGDERLLHAFSTMQLDNPKAVESITKMMKWCEHQADLEREMPKLLAKDEETKKAQEKQMKTGKFNDQKIYQYIKERAKADTMRDFAPAIIDCTKTYTYEQMYRYWDDYARVFSALGINDKNHSRVAIAGSISAEPLFAFYALNMTGAEVSMFSYPDFMPGGRWKTMVEKEHITDLFISDIVVTPDLFKKMLKEKKKLGLRNIILVHSLLGGPTVGPAELVFNEMNYHSLQQVKGAVFMSDLLEKYKDGEITYGEKGGDHLAIITHTSGTTKGTRKPLPYTDRAVNTVASNLPNGLNSEGGIDNKIRLKCAMSFDFSSFLNMCGLANVTLASGECLVLTFFGGMHPKFYRAISYYKLDVIFTASFMVDNWMKINGIGDDEFASLKIFATGGSYLPTDKLKKYKQFLKQHGYTGDIMRGYGMSETGGAQLTVPKDCDDDILGYPKPAENFRVLNEADHKFYPGDAKGVTGVMYIASDSLCMNELDGEKLFDYTEIDGHNFLCTNDMVRINDNGSFSYVGRMDRYFVNNEGVRFESGMAERYLTAHENIDKCAFVPVLDKRIHDTVPVLYVVPAKKKEAANKIKQAISDIFLHNDAMKGSVLPSQFVIVEDIPHNVNGKIDIYQITRNRLNGKAYDIIPVKNGKKVEDIEIKLVDKTNSMFGGTLPEGMGKDSAMNVFDLFSVTDFHKLQKPELKIKKPEVKLPLPDTKELMSKVKISSEAMDKMQVLSGKLQGKMYGSSEITHDFEE